MDEFVYLGSWIASFEHNFLVRKAKAWDKMKPLWQSDLRRDQKINHFQATVETWIMTDSLKINVCYTRMLWNVVDSNWRTHRRTRQDQRPDQWRLTELHRVTTKIQQRRMRLASHLYRYPDLVGHKLGLREPKHGR